jgi:hypothetical protein
MRATRRSSFPPAQVVAAGANSLAFVERGLEALDGTGLRDDDKLRVIGLLSSYTLSQAPMANDAARAAAEAAAGSTAAPGWSYEALLRELADEQTYPRLHRLAWSGSRRQPVALRGPGGVPVRRGRDPRRRPSPDRSEQGHRAAMTPPIASSRLTRTMVSRVGNAIAAQITTFGRDTGDRADDQVGLQIGRIFRGPAE